MSAPAATSPSGLGRFLGEAISVVSHPMLGATYLLVLLLLVNPYLFGVNGIGERLPLLALVLGSSVLIPGLVILMMVGLEMLPSIRMPEREQRTIPLIAVGMLYLGLFAFCRKAPEVPVAYTALVLGCVSGLFAAFFANLFTKISLHAVGMGGLVAGVIVVSELLAYDRLAILLPGSMKVTVSLLAVLVATILAAGLVGTVRLWLQAHTLEDILGGYVVGFVAMGLSVYLYF